MESTLITYFAGTIAWVYQAKVTIRDEAVIAAATISLLKRFTWIFFRRFKKLFEEKCCVRLISFHQLDVKLLDLTHNSGSSSINLPALKLIS